MLKIVIGLVLFGLILLVHEGKCCPDGWITHRSACYLFSREVQTWIGAMQMCREWEGHLVEIEDVSKNAFLTTYASYRNHKFWIGLTDVVVENTWVWMDSKQILYNQNYHNWHKGQPDNLNNDENCVVLDNDFHYQWTDYPCTSLFHYICELPEVGIGGIVGR
ncbi:complement activation [Mactra antiquata]